MATVRELFAPHFDQVSFQDTGLVAILVYEEEEVEGYEADGEPLGLEFTPIEELLDVEVVSDLHIEEIRRALAHELTWGGQTNEVEAVLVSYL